MAQLQQTHSGIVYLTSFLAALAGLLFGYDTGVISGALLFIKQAFPLSATLEGMVVSAVLVGAFIGVATATPLTDRFGRRRILIWTAVIFAMGSLASSLATGVIVLMLSRFVLGLAIGASSMCAPVYLAEIAPRDIRGTMVSLFQFFITLGILFAYAVDYALAPHWRWMLLFGLLPALVLFIGMLPSPESPRWLVAQGQEQNARQLLRRIRVSDTDVAKELDEIKTSLAQQSGGFAELRSPRLRPALIIAVALAIFQQITGINAVIYFAPSIFKAAGFTSDVGALLATIGVGTVNVLATIVAMYAIDRAGRRSLLLWGTSGMLITLVALGGLFWMGPTAPSWLTLLSVLVFIVSFAIGLGPVFWLLAAEIFPLEVRSLGMGIASFCNWGSNFIVALTFPILLTNLGGSIVFWLYGAFSLIALLFIWAYVPETKGKSLEEIEAYWRESVISSGAA